MFDTSEASRVRNRIAALYDIHGNLPALDAVLAEVLSANVDLIVVGGDVVPGPMPSESLDRLLALEIPTRFIHGNGDREVLAVMDGAEPSSVPARFRAPLYWAAEQLGPQHQAALRSWPSTISVTVDGLGEVLFCHATPRNDTEIFTRLTPEASLLPVFAYAGASCVVCGHTHMQFDREVGPTRVINAGSVGMPFGRTGAHWLEMGPDVRLRITEYDMERAAERIAQTGYPDASGFAGTNVLSVPAEEAMLQAFSNAEIGSADSGHPRGD